MPPCTDQIDLLVPSTAVVINNFKVIIFKVNLPICSVENMPVLVSRGNCTFWKDRIRIQVDRWGSIVPSNVEPPVVNISNDKGSIQWACLQ